MGFERRRNLLTTKEGKNKTRKEAAWPEKIYDFNIGHFFEIEKKKNIFNTKMKIPRIYVSCRYNRRKDEERNVGVM